MKRELIISTYDSLGNPHYSGGGADAVHAVAKELADEFRITILAANFPGAKNRFVDAVHYHYIGLSFVGPQLGQALFHLQLPFYVLTKHFDIWVESFTPPISTSFLPLFTRKPVVGLIHMLSGADMRRKYGLPFDWVEDLGLRLYKNFIVLSESTKEKLLKIKKTAHILVTKNGIEKPKSLKDYTLRKKDYFLFIGRIEVDQKGLDLLLKNFISVYKQTGLPLKIAGSGTVAEMEKLTKLIAKYDLHSCVELLGRVVGAEKHQLLSHASIIVIPSRFETFSITALESIAYNVPLLCCNIPGMRWIPKGDSVKFTYNSSSSLAKNLISLQKNEVLKKQISQNQKLTVKNFSWKKISEEYKTFLNQIVA